MYSKHTMQGFCGPALRSAQQAATTVLPGLPVWAMLLLSLSAAPIANAAVTPKLDGGADHIVALRPDGSVWAWGDVDAQSVLSDLTGDQLYAVPIRAADGTPLDGVKDVAAGQNFTVAVTDGGQVLAWGWNGDGQLGDGTTATATRSTPEPVVHEDGTPLADVVQVAADGDHALAVTAGGEVWAWGDNEYGQLGDGTTENRHHPVQVTGLSDVVAVAAGFGESYALDGGGQVWEWGGNKTEPEMVVDAAGDPLGGVTAIAAGNSHAVALGSDGRVWTWGDNYWGQLGDGTTTDRDYADVVVHSDDTELTGVTAIAAGRYHTMALGGDGVVRAWGHNRDGELGTGYHSKHPAEVVDGGGNPYTDFVAIEGGGNSLAGYGFSLGVTESGFVRAWGSNSDGQLGDGTKNDRDHPVASLALLRFDDSPSPFLLRPAVAIPTSQSPTGGEAVSTEPVLAAGAYAVAGGSEGHRASRWRIGANENLNGNGEEINLSGYSYYRFYDLPFTLPFFGRTIERIGISTQGSIELFEAGEDLGITDSWGGYTLHDYPWEEGKGSHDEPEAEDLLYAFSAEHNMDAVSVRDHGDHVVVDWRGVTGDDENNGTYLLENHPLKFQVVLHDDGRIRWNFIELTYNDYYGDLFSGLYAQVEGTEIKVSDETDADAPRSFVYDPQTQTVSEVAFEEDTHSYLVYDSGETTADLENHPVPSTAGLEPGETYYWSVRYQAENRAWSGWSETAAFTVSEPPVALAGDDQDAGPGQTVVLDGSGSYAPGGTVTGYTWNQTSGPAVTLVDADSATASFTAPDVDALTSLEFGLTVTDDVGNTDEAATLVSVHTTDEDGDGDGVGFGDEGSVPSLDGGSDGDGNGDGTADGHQPHVASLPAAEGNDYATIELPGGGRERPLSLADVTAGAAPADAPAGYYFPHGVLSFTVEDVAPDGSAEVSVYVPHDPGIVDYYKRHVETGEWEALDATVEHLPASNPSKTRLTFTLANGGPYDADGDGSNSSIEDPGGPVARSEAIPTLSQWALLLLAALLAAMGAYRRQGGIA